MHWHLFLLQSSKKFFFFQELKAEDFQKKLIFVEIAHKIGVLLKIIKIEIVGSDFQNV